MPEKMEAGSSFLEHAGVKGMKWGVRKDRRGNFLNNPSRGKAINFGSYGRKSAYTSPSALSKRVKAGKLRIASLLSSAGLLAVTAIAANTDSKLTLGLNFLQGALGVTSLVTAAGSTVTAVKAIDEELSNRNKNS